MPGEAIANAPFEQRAKTTVDITKDVLNIVRDLCLLVVFFVLLFSKNFSNYLSNRGISSINAGFIVWKSQASAAAQDTSAAAASLQRVASSLNAIANTSRDPAVKQSAAAAVSELDGSLNTLDNANSKLAAAVAVATETNSTASAAPPAADGWAYLGEADRAHKTWMNPPQPKVNTSVPVLQSGQTVTLTDSVFLHADKGQGQTFNQAAILTAIAAGSMVTVREEQFSPALNGGDFVWAKVQALR